MQEHEIRRGAVQMALAMLLSGTLGWFVLQSGQGVWNVVFARCVIGTLGLGLYSAWRLGSRSWGFTRISLLWCAAGGVALVGNWLLLFSAYRFCGMGLATVVYHTQPFWLVLLGRFWLGERLSARRALALLLAFAGLVLVVQPGRMGLGDMSGVGLALGAAVLYALATLISKRLPAAWLPSQVACVQTAVGVLLLWPLADLPALGHAGASWPYLAVIGLVHTVLMYILMYAAFRRLPTAWIGLLGFIYPLVALVVDDLAYGHALNAAQAAGVALIVIANVWGLQRQGALPAWRGRRMAG